ncbi:MAG: hypothetical protein ACI3ZI_09185 [Candidatus Cryptobacteroides sp.]
MKSRIIPYSLIIASTIILCTSFQCSKEHYHATWVNNYFSYINNSENVVDFFFEHFRGESYFDEERGEWVSLHIPDNFDVIMYPMEKVATKYCFPLYEDEVGVVDEQQYFFQRYLEKLNAYGGCVYIYKYDLETQSRGKLIKKWVPSGNESRWSYSQIDSVNRQWTINLFE